MKKNILFMAQLPPPVHGAALRNQSLLESPLLNEEFNIISLPLKFIDEMKEMGTFTFKKLLLMIRHAWRMIVILSTKKVDLVYFTMNPSGNAFYRDILFIAIIKIFRKKRLLHFRMKGLQRTAGSPIGKTLIKFAFEGSELVSLSNHHLTDMKGLTSHPPFIVPNGIKVEHQFLPLAETYQYQPSSVPQLLFLSNLSVRKGVKELIDALLIVKEQGVLFHLSLVGNEWDMSFSDVQQYIDERGLTDQIIIAGPKFGKEKFEAIAACDLFVFPTWFELFPGVILEAMQFGKPIVSTLEGSIPDIIDHGTNGVLVEPKNAKALAAGITRMLSNPEERLLMARNAKEKFFRDFTLEAFENNMKTVYQQVTA